MADDPIPADLRDFILRYIDSVAHLEALLLLRANPETAWQAAAVNSTGRGAHSATKQF